MHLKSLFSLFVILFLFDQYAFSQTDTLRITSATNTDNFLIPFQNFQADHQIGGLIAIADRHQYPFPQKVLDLQKQLTLNQKQVDALTIINKELKRKVLEMNVFLINNERTLDSLFRTHRLNNGTLIFYANRYGLYQGEMRNALLQACLKTEAILTSLQIKKYGRLQGF